MSLVILAGSSHYSFAQQVGRGIGYEVKDGALTCSRFSNGETLVVVQDSVRDRDVFIIQTAAEPVNDLLMELLITIHVCKIASARRITAVMPCFPYARQDRKDRSRAPITAKLVANMLETAGCHHVILYAEPVMVAFIKQELAGQNLVIVSPDAGGAKRAAAIADRLGLDLALIHKERKVANQVSRMILVGDVAGKTAVLVDDIADTCGTLALAAEVLISNAAERCIAIVTHGFLSGAAVEVIEKSSIEYLAVANTLPLPEHARACSKIRTFDISSLIGEAIRRTHNGESISLLFQSEGTLK